MQFIWFILDNGNMSCLMGLPHHITPILSGGYALLIPNYVLHSLGGWCLLWCFSPFIYRGYM